jgi:hypothetical protein
VVALWEVRVATAGVATAREEAAVTRAKEAAMVATAKVEA